MKQLRPICGWGEWFASEDAAERSYARHLNDERHLLGLRAAEESAERIERYRLEDLASRG